MVLLRGNTDTCSMYKKSYVLGGISLKFWSDCILSVVYLVNRLPSSVLNGKSPFEMVHKKKPCLPHLSSNDEGKAPSVVDGSDISSEFDTTDTAHNLYHEEGVTTTQVDENIIFKDSRHDVSSPSGSRSILQPNEVQTLGPRRSNSVSPPNLPWASSKSATATTSERIARRHLESMTTSERIAMPSPRAVNPSFINNLVRLRLHPVSLPIESKSRFFSTWMSFGGNTRDLGSFGEEADNITDLHQIHEELLFTECGDGITCIKRCRRDLSSDDVRDLVTTSGRGRLKEDLESSTETNPGLCSSFKGDENPIRTLGDYSKPSHEGYRNTIELPVGNNVVPLRSDTIRLVQNGCSFHGLRSEDPNQHLKDFLKLVDSLDLDGENRERTRLRLFQFSLRDQASNWLERLPAGSITTWEDLTTRFLAQFIPPRRTVKLRNDIQMFQKHHGESLSEAWTRFKDLL
ncbi:zinc finger, CCHC-type containing protein [Tanacetum coccineum]